MATIGNDPNGHRRILFVAGDGRRKTIRLGKATMKQAEAFKVKVEQLVSAKYSGGSMDDETSRWLGALDDVMHGRLSAVDLAASRKAASRRNMTIGQLVKESAATWNRHKPNTRRNYTQAAARLEQHFTATKLVREVDSLEADRFRTWLEGEGLAQATISKYIINIRGMFKRAIKWKVIVENPFADVTAGTQKNKSRQHFVSAADASKLLESCPDAEWRLLVALSRYGGMRCPSETLSLRWSDIDWDAGRILVTSPKTEHHEGGDTRTMPLFPELRQYLLESFEQAAEGATYVIGRYRPSDGATPLNLRTQLLRIITRAGLKRWPKPWHNMRASRQTELEDSFPSHVVCSWLGNSESIARGHYLLVTDEHFARATSEQAAQNPAQYRAELVGTAQNAEPLPPQNHRELPPVTTGCNSTLLTGCSREGSNL